MFNQPIYFKQAIAFVRKCNVSSKPVRVWKKHGGRRIKMWDGYLVIEEKWY